MRAFSWRAVADTEAFRLAALFALLFLVLTAALLTAVFWIVQDAQLRSLAAANEADIAAIENGWREEGPGEALEVVRQLLGSPQYPGSYPPRAFIDVEEFEARARAGNFHPPEHRSGPATLRLAGRGYSIVGEGSTFGDGVYVFVGRDTRQIDATRARLLRAFAWISGAALAVGASGGCLFGREYLRRVRRITRTCQAIVAGRFEERIPTRGSANELDRLATTINDMLNRISTLLENLRQVSSDVAHDLRTPLARLRSRLEAVNTGSAGAPEYAVVVQRALEDTDQLLGLFAAILRVSQIESGSRLASFGPVSMTALMEKVVELYRPVTEDEGRVLSAHVEAGVTLRGDGELLLQLFSNLIENAIRHTPAGTQIRVTLAAQESDGVRSVVAMVADSGEGIAAQERDKVVRRFYRASNSRSTPGYGLGLALVAAIANLHQAKLELQDAAPGLRVTVTFVEARG